MKVVAGYVGSVEVFKRLIAWNLLDLPIRSKVRVRHINRHRYMRKITVRRGGGDAA